MEQIFKIIENIHKSLLTTTLGVIIILASCASVFFPPLNMDWTKASIGIAIGLALLGSPDPKSNAGGKAVVILVCLAFGLLLESCTRPQVTSSVEEHDSTYVVERVRIDTVTIAGDSVPFMIQVPCPDQFKPGQKQPEKKYSFESKDKRAELLITIDSTGKETGECFCEAEKAIIQSKDKEIHQLKSRTTVKTITNEVYKTHWYDIACRWIAGLALLFIVLKLTLKF